MNKKLNNYSSAKYKYTENMVTINVRIRDSITVPESFYNSIKSKIRFYLPYLQDSSYFVMEDLLGVGDWGSFTEAEKQMAKVCIAHMAQSGEYPICPRGPVFEYPQSYVMSDARRNAD